MPDFSGFQVAPVPLNPLFSLANADDQYLKNQLGQQALQAETMKNDLTRQIQPIQINALLSSMRDTSNDPLPSGSPPLGTAGAMQTGGTPVVKQPQQGVSLLSGSTPVSADPHAQNLVAQTASSLGVNPDWAQRVQYAESGGYKNAASAVSPKGALGIMQLMPDTAKGLGVDPNDPTQNVQGGVKYLAQMKQQFGDPRIATAAYNAGPGRVQDWLAGKAPLPDETVNYVGKVFGGDGVGILSDALSGAHGHNISGVQSDGAGLQPVQQDDTARRNVLKLVQQRDFWMARSAMGDTGASRAASGIQAQLDNIAGPGGIVDSRTGYVYRVPGSYQTRYAAANATEAGKVGPSAQLHQLNSNTDTAAAAQRGAQQTFEEGNRPQVIDGKLVVPNQVRGVTAPTVAPGQQPMATPVTGPNIPALASPTPNAVTPDASHAPAPTTQPGVTTIQPDQAAIAGKESAALDAKRADSIQQPIIDQAKEGQMALNRIAAARAAIKAASQGGVPPGYFSDALGKSAAMAKSLGIDLSQFGIHPEAVANQQVAEENIAQINGAILKSIFPTRITDSDINTFGKKLGSINMDPLSLDAILNQAEPVAKYAVDRAKDMHSYAVQHGNLLGWEHAFYNKNGYGPDLFDTQKSGTVPGVSSAPPTPPAAPAATVSPPIGAVQHLLQNPGLAAQFDQKFGPGAAQRVLGR